MASAANSPVFVHDCKPVYAREPRPLEPSILDPNNTVEVGLGDWYSIVAGETFVKSWGEKGSSPLYGIQAVWV